MFTIVCCVFFLLSFFRFLLLCVYCYLLPSWRNKVYIYNQSIPLAMSGISMHATTTTCTTTTTTTPTSKCNYSFFCLTSLHFEGKMFGTALLVCQPTAMGVWKTESQFGSQKLM